MAELERLVKIVPILGLSVALVYWTGRWYTEWYLNQFATNYTEIRCDRSDYLHASWNTVLTAICGLIILSHIALALYVLPEWYWLAFTAIATLTSTAILAFWPFLFDPYSSFFKRLLGAREFSLQAVGWISLPVTSVLAYQYRQKLIPVWSTLFVIVQQDSFAIMVIMLLFLFAWIYLALVGYLLGRYHGQSAIWEGRMGVRWVKVKGTWWILVLRTDDGRNLVYNRKQGISKFISDEEIEQTNGFVTRTPK